MLRAVRAEREALEVGGDFPNDGVERLLAADLCGSGRPVGAANRLFEAVLLVNGRPDAPEWGRRGDVDLKLLSGPTYDAFARGGLIECPDDTGDGRHDLELASNIGDVILDHRVI